jgi:hypothetical protein
MDLVEGSADSSSKISYLRTSHLLLEDTMSMDQVGWTVLRRSVFLIYMVKCALSMISHLRTSLLLPEDTM